jgi:hypothetical protein
MPLGSKKRDIPPEEIHSISKNSSIGIPIRIPVWGKALLVKDSQMCILSLSRLRKTKWDIKYNNDTFIVTKGNISVSFPLHHGLYFESEKNAPKDVEKVVASSVNPYRLYTAAQLQGAKVAAELHRYLGHPSNGVLTSMLRNGVLTDWPCSVDDINNMSKINGPCGPCRQGKMTRTTAKESKSMKSTKIAQVLHCDVIYIKIRGKDIGSYLSTVDEATGHLTSTLLSDKSRESLVEACNRVKTTYKGYGHKVERMCWDQEKGIVKQDFNDLGIIISRVGPEQHEKRSEGIHVLLEMLFEH